jgi:hypothetical protein
MAEDTIDVDIHLTLREEFDQFHIAVAHSVHEWVPIVGSVELVEEMREGREEVYDLFCLPLFLFNRRVQIQQKILLT